MDKVILTDVDGVLLNWFEAFDNFAEETRPELLQQGSCATLASQNCLHKWLGLPGFKEAKEVVASFYGSPADRRMLAYIDALEYIPRLHREGWKLIAITHSVHPQKSHTVKLECLQRNFGDIFELHSLNIDESKAVYLEKYSPAFWIEDNLKNAIAGAQCGHHPLLISRKEWGQIPEKILLASQEQIPVRESDDFRKIEIVNDWKEIYTRICSVDSPLIQDVSLAPA